MKNCETQFTRHFKTPTGFDNSAQGSEARATLGNRAETGITLKGLRRSAAMRLNPFRVEIDSDITPSVSQPWAERHNPFGIEEA